VSRPIPIVEARGIRVDRSGLTILDVPELSIVEGEVLSLVGPNGAGKTTLLQTLLFLNKPFEGEIFFRARKVGIDYPILSYRRKLAMAFQEPLLFDLTVSENVASGLKLRGFDKAITRSRTAQYLDMFGISQLSSRSTRSLSGGEAQRTSLARAFAVGPEVIFLDEPFASLDPRSREPLIDDVQNILKATKTTAVFVTHDLMDALRLSDTIAVMEAGRILQMGPAEDVMNKPINESVASLVGIGTTVSGIVAGCDGDSVVVKIGDREIETIGDFVKGEKLGIFIRPENVTLSVIPPDQTGTQPLSSARNSLPGVVMSVTSMGHFYKVRVDCGFPLASLVTRQSVENLDLRQGQSVVASFKATAVHPMRKASSDKLT
jgi:tungstate transport system ATP-binding protein